MAWLDGIIDSNDSTDISLSELWEMVKGREAWHAAVHGVAVRHNLATEQQSLPDVVFVFLLIICFSR